MASKTDICHSVRRVPRFRGRLRYVPIFQLPPSTELVFTCAEYKQPDEPRIVNGTNESWLKILPAGTYTIFTGIFYESFLLTPMNTYSVRFLNRCFAPSSFFEANTIIKGENYRLTSGPIETILVLSDKKPVFKLDKDDLKEPRKTRVRKQRRTRNIPLRKRVF